MRPSWGWTLNTRPVLPASSPAITITVSSLRMFMIRFLIRRLTALGSPSNDFSRQADDLHEIALAQLAGHGPENTRTARVVLGIDEDDRVAIEPNIAAVVAAGGF